MNRKAGTMQHDEALSQLLQKYQLTAADYLGQGMEALVYRAGASDVLKVYRQPVDVAYLHRLQRLYAAIYRRSVPFAVPEIGHIAAEDAYMWWCVNAFWRDSIHTLLPCVQKQRMSKITHHAHIAECGPACAESFDL